MKKKLIMIPIAAIILLLAAIGILVAHLVNANTEAPNGTTGGTVEQPGGDSASDERETPEPDIEPEPEPEPDVAEIMEKRLGDFKAFAGSGSVGGKDRKRGRRPDSRRSGGSSVCIAVVFLPEPR